MATSDVIADDSTTLATGLVVPSTVAPGSEPRDTCTDPGPASQSHRLPVTLKHLKGKEAEWDPITRRTGPLGLLDLPVDVLGLIVREASGR